MHTFTVRRLRVDLDTPFERRWNGGDAFRTAFFDALSMSFPIGEQYFIDSLRQGVAALPPGRRARFEPTLREFVGQEATHRRLHLKVNQQLATQGHQNHWERRVARRLARLAGLDVRHHVAMTAAVEHITAILSLHLLATPAALEGAPPRLATLWRWHAAEELEHCSAAFDLYRELAGSERWRRCWLVVSSVHFALDLARQTVCNLRHEGALWEWASARSAWRFLLGQGGLLRTVAGPWCAYLRRDFHPSQHDALPARDWLRDNAHQFRVVGAPS